MKSFYVLLAAVVISVVGSAAYLSSEENDKHKDSVLIYNDEYVNVGMSGREYGQYQRFINSDDLIIRIKHLEEELAEAKKRVVYWHHYAWQAENGVLPWQWE